MNPSPGESYSLMKEIDSKPGHCKRCGGVEMHRIPGSIGKLPEEGTGLLAWRFQRKASCRCRWQTKGELTR